MTGVPHFSLNEASALAVRLYGFAATATDLPSERDQNFQLRDSNPQMIEQRVGRRMGNSDTAASRAASDAERRWPVDAT